MITCLQQDSLPILNATTSPIPAYNNVTLTEVACSAIYGAALTPGNGSLRKLLQKNISECLQLWNDPDGPAWLVPHLELIAAKQTWSFGADSSEDNKTITLGYFTKCERWMNEFRKRPVTAATADDVKPKKRSLASASNSKAIQLALDAADRDNAAAGLINQTTARFYELLSRQVLAGTIVLKGIAITQNDGTLVPREIGAPPHASIPLDYFMMPTVHDLFDNELELNRFATEAEVASSIFDRRVREFESTLVRWRDVKLSPDHAALLYRIFIENNSNPKAVRGRKPTMQYAALHEEFLRLMDHHGPFSNDDPNWNGVEKLIAALQLFHAAKYKTDPARTTLQPHVHNWLNALTAKKGAGN